MMRKSSNPPKLVIKPFKVQPKLPDNFEDSSWDKLKAAIHAVYNQVSTEISKEELYQCVEDLCLHKKSVVLYGYLKIEIELHVKYVVKKLVEQAFDLSTFLKSVDAIWRNYVGSMSTIRNIFLFLDRTYALQTTGVKPIWNLGLDLLRQNLLGQSELVDHIIMSLLYSVELERRGQLVDREAMRRLLRMLVSLGLYANRFEGPFLQDSQRFFETEGRLLIDAATPAQFLLRVEFRLKEAVDMVNWYLEQSSRSALITAVERQMLAPHVNQLVERGLSSLLAEVTLPGQGRYSLKNSESSNPLNGNGRSLIDTTNMPLDTGNMSTVQTLSSSSLSAESGLSYQVEPRMQDLKRMYSLLDRVKGLDMLQREWITFIRSAGESLIGRQDSERERVLIDEVLCFHDNIEKVLMHCFNNQDEFKGSMKSTFESFLNEKQGSRSAELLARYVDRKLRGEKGITDADVENALCQAARLFRYLQEKDVFEAFYKKMLAKRLLLGKSANYDSEKSMLSKLRTECGSNYTSKLEGMFQDIELSRDVLSAYQQHKTAAGLIVKSLSFTDHSVPSPSSGDAVYASEFIATVTPSERRKLITPEFHAQVLTTGFWPSAPSSEGLVVPEEVRALQKQFNDFYVSKYQGRRLVWAHALERCVITARFPKGRKELDVSFFQAVVLLSFNDAASQSLTEIRMATHIEDMELRRTLLSLCNGLVGTRVLVKEPKGREITDNDTFMFNVEFTSKLYRVKINTIQLKESVEEIERTHEEVFHERQYQVDAVIVRTMKARKMMAHSALISELMIQLRFPARSTDLKKRIESLIEREYLARNKDDPSTYIYLA